MYGNEWSRDIDGKVFTSVEEEQIWGGEPAVLSTQIDLEGVVDKWQNRTAGIVWPSSGRASGATKQGPAKVDVKLREKVWEVEAGEGGMGTRDGGDDVRWSDNVGTYLCAFIYYTSMVEMERVVGKRRDTAFSEYFPGFEGGWANCAVAHQCMCRCWRARRRFRWGWRSRLSLCSRWWRCGGRRGWRRELLEVGGDCGTADARECRNDCGRAVEH